MSEPPGSPEYYAPEPQPLPSVPPPPSIADAAAQYDAEQADGGIPGYGVPGYVAPTATGPAYPTGPTPTVAEMFAPAMNRTKLGAALASLLIGVIALFASLVPVFGVLFGLIAAILGAVGLAKKQPKGLAVTGLVLGLVAALISGVMTAVVFLSVTEDDPNADGWFSYGTDAQATIGTPFVPGALAVTEQAFGQDSLSDEVWWYVVVLDNPSGSAYPAADVTVQALGADGSVIDTSWTYASLPSGETALYGEFWDLKGEIADLAVTGPTVEGLSLDAQVGTVTPTDVAAATDDFSTTVTGTLVSTLEEDGDAVVVTVVARDASGGIVGGANAYVDSLPAGDSADFEAYFFEPLPEGTQYEVYWSSF